VTGPAPAWPVAELDRIARLRALAAALPGVVLHERVLDHPFDAVWAVATDFEGAVPQWEADVSAARVRRRERVAPTRERIDLIANGPWWMGGRAMGFDVDLDLDLDGGWCWMVARRPKVYVVGMAAEPMEGADGRWQTRFAHLEGVVLAAPRWAAPLVRPVLAVSRWRHRHHVPADVDGIAAVLDRG
jgi:hypothetical protein